MQKGSLLPVRGNLGCPSGKAGEPLLLLEGSLFMFSGWESAVLAGLQTVNEILTAGIAITAFSLLLYAFSFNLRDRVARSFAVVLSCVVIIFTSEAIASSIEQPYAEFLLRLQWVGLVFLPAGYLHLSDALLVTAGRPSRGRRRWAVRFVYLVSLVFLAALLSGKLVTGGCDCLQITFVRMDSFKSETKRVECCHGNIIEHK